MTTGLNRALPWHGSLARRAAATALRLVQDWYRRHRDLRHLTQLDDYLLRDVGLTREQVNRGSLAPSFRR